MAFSKNAVLKHLRMLARPNRLFHYPPPSIITLRHLSFATTEEAAAERRRRKRRLRIEPPLSSLNRSQQPVQQPIPKPIQNPNAPKLPEPVSTLSGKRLELHNKILTLIRENNLEEAALYTRHSVYSNCRPTIFTINAVLNAQLRQSKYAEFLSLHRFITQAGIAPNIVTYNLVFQTYLDCRKPDTAMEHYKQFINDSPVYPSPTTYRILAKGLVDNGKLDRALELKDEMVDKGLSPDSIVYSYLMSGLAKTEDSDGILRLYEELKEKKGGFVKDGVVYGPLMKGYFLKGMEEDAMRCYEEACGDNLRLKMTAVAYNYVLDALIKNAKFDMALELFQRLKTQHNPPRELVVNLGTFNIMVDGYCREGRFEDAMEVFRSRNDYGCSADTLSYNNLIDQLCQNCMLVEAEQLCKEMSDHGVKPDEYTYVLLMDTCIKEGRLDDGAAYFKTMVDLGLRPNLVVYNRLIDELVKVGKVDEAKSFYDVMVKKLKMDNESYKFMLKAMSDAGNLDEVMNMVDHILDDEGAEFDQELQEFVKGELSKDGREDDLMKLMEEKERLKAEAKARELEKAEAAKRSAREAVASLIPSKLFGNKDGESESAASAETSSKLSSSGAGEAAPETVEEGTIMESVASSGLVDSVNDGATVQATA